MKETPLLVSNGRVCHNDDVIKEDQADIESDDDDGRLQIDESPAAGVLSPNLAATIPRTDHHLFPQLTPRCDDQNAPKTHILKAAHGLGGNGELLQFEPNVGNVDVAIPLTDHRQRTSGLSPRTLDAPSVPVLDAPAQELLANGGLPQFAQSATGNVDGGPAGLATTEPKKKPRKKRKKKVVADDITINGGLTTAGTTGVPLTDLSTVAEFVDESCKEEIVGGFALLCFETVGNLENFTKRQQEHAERCRRLIDCNTALATKATKAKTARKNTRKNKENVFKAAKMKSESPLKAEPLKRAPDKQDGPVDDDGDADKRSPKVAKIEHDSTPTLHVADSTNSPPPTLVHDDSRPSPSTVVHQADSTADAQDATEGPSQEEVNPPQQQPGPASSSQQPPRTAPLDATTALPSTTALSTVHQQQNNPLQSLMATGGLFPTVGSHLQAPSTLSTEATNPNLLGNSAAAFATAIQQSQMAAATAACLPSTSQASTSFAGMSPMQQQQLASLLPFSGLLSPYGPAAAGMLLNGGLTNHNTMAPTSDGALTNQFASSGGHMAPSRPDTTSKEHGRWCSMHVKIAWNIANKRYAPPPSNGGVPTPTRVRPQQSTSSSDGAGNTMATSSTNGGSIAAHSPMTSASAQHRRHAKKHSLTPNKPSNDFLRPSLTNGVPQRKGSATPAGDVSALHKPANASTSHIPGNSILSPQPPTSKAPQQACRPPSSGTVPTSSHRNHRPSATNHTPTTSQFASPPLSSAGVVNSLNLFQQQQQMMQMAELLNRSQTADLAAQYAALNGGRPLPHGLPPLPFSSLGADLSGGGHPGMTSMAAALAPQLLMNGLFNGGTTAAATNGRDQQQAELLRWQAALFGGLPPSSAAELGPSVAAAMELERQRQQQAAARTFNPFLPPGLAPSAIQQQQTMEQFLNAQSLAMLLQGSAAANGAGGPSSAAGGPFGALPSGVPDVSKLTMPFSNTLEQLARQKQLYGMPPASCADLLRR